jgi:hypothetical protein
MPQDFRNYQQKSIGLIKKLKIKLASENVQLKHGYDITCVDKVSKSFTSEPGL